MGVKALLKGWMTTFPQPLPKNFRTFRAQRRIGEMRNLANLRLPSPVSVIGFANSYPVHNLREMIYIERSSFGHCSVEGATYEVNDVRK
jgi:hypothetical protein